MQMSEMDESTGPSELQELPPEQFGLPRAEPGMWGSCVRLINPVSMESVTVVDLDDNEAAFS